MGSVGVLQEVFYSLELMAACPGYNFIVLNSVLQVFIPLYSTVDGVYNPLCNNADGLTQLRI